MSKFSNLPKKEPESFIHAARGSDGEQPKRGRPITGSTKERRNISFSLATRERLELIQRKLAVEVVSQSDMGISDLTHSAMIEASIIAFEQLPISQQIEMLRKALAT
jgi:hypothetical protein